MDNLDVLAPRKGTPLSQWFHCCFPNNHETSADGGKTMREISLMDDLTATESSEYDSSEPNTPDAGAATADTTYTNSTSAEEDHSCFHDAAASPESFDAARTLNETTDPLLQPPSTKTTAKTLTTFTTASKYTQEVWNVIVAVLCLNMLAQLWSRRQTTTLAVSQNKPEAPQAAQQPAN